MRTRRTILPMVLAVVVAAAAAAVYLVRRDPGTPAAPQLAAAQGGSAERSRFDTLYNRAIRASEEGDLATLTGTGPQALAAYRALPAPDIDARYHAAMLLLATGDPEGAQALADSIAAIEPTHLFPVLVREAVARRRGDAEGAAAELANFLRLYDAEIGAGRVEYVHHRFVLDQALAEARRGAGRGGQ
ncbi:MAG: hypothetical protein ACYC2K_00740 [Gemmatimonadales bacterium]